jgi:hypothetical protein
MMRCGECGLSITAEHKVNRFGSHYVYYRCTRRRRDYHCRQPVVSLPDLERQMVAFLEEITLPERFHRWALRRLERIAKREGDTVTVQRRSVEQALAATDRQLENLTKLRLRDLLSDDEYVHARQQLDRERLRLGQALERAVATDSWFEPARQLISFNAQAAFRCRTGTLAEKRLILEIVCSNPTLRDRKLLLEAAKPFRRWAGTADFSSVCGYVEDVRTFMQSPDSERILQNLQRLPHPQPEDQRLAAA